MVSFIVLSVHIVPSAPKAKIADFDVKPDEVLGEGALLYGDFMMPNTDNKIYEEITDHAKVQLYPRRILILVHKLCRRALFLIG